MATTHHTYPDLITDGGRLARTCWQTSDLSQAVAATLRIDPDAVILLATGTMPGQAIRALAPGGMAA